MGIVDALLWWAGVQAVGFITLPLSLLFFRALPAAGYAFHKLLGLLLFAFFGWTFMAFGVLPNTRWALFVVLALLALLSLLTMRFARLPNRRDPELRTQVLFVEGLFLILFVACALLRCAAPMISGSEKFMNFMFLNSILRSVELPPQDAWAAGLSINYYYFGHLLVAYLTKATGIKPGVAFNVAQALFFALSGLGAYAVAYTLAAVSRSEESDLPKNVRPMNPTLVGLLAAVTLLLMGNLLAAWKLVTDPAFLQHSFSDGVGWHSARVIETVENGHLVDQPITEFPAFTIFLGDMHAHFMAMPFVLLAVGTAFLWFLKPDYALRLNLDRSVRTVGSAIIFGSISVLTAWFLPACAGLWAAGVLVSLRQHGKLAWAKDAVVWGIVTTVLAVVAFAPFYRKFVSPVATVQFVTYRTSFPQFFLMFGAFLVPIVAVLLVTAWELCSASPAAAKQTRVQPQPKGRRRQAVKPAAVQSNSATDSVAAHRFSTTRLGLFATWILVTVGLAVLARSYAVIVFTASVAVAASVLVWHKQRSQPLVFALLLAGFAAALMLAPEIGYLKDVQPVPYMRAVTTFKFYYQAWIFLAPACAFVIPYVVRRLARASRTGAWAFRSVATALILGGLLYTARVAPQLAGPCQTLDGTAFCATAAPDEDRAMTWLLNNAAPGSRLVEAVGNSYSNDARVSAFTGIPTVLGWKAHELIWRGDRRLPTERSREVRAFYTIASAAQARQFLHRWGISYLLVGERERQHYGPSVERFVQWFPVLFQSGDLYVLNARSSTATQ